MRCLRYQGIKYPCIWSRRGDNELLDIYPSNYVLSETVSELILIHLFKY